MKTIVKGLIGAEDLSRGFGTFSRTTSTGGVQTMTQIALSGRGGLFVGDEWATYWGVADIGAQLNAAYAALPATGGVIFITPRNADPIIGCQPYTWTTSVVFGTKGKYVILKGLAPASQSGPAGAANSQGGATLNWTGTTGGTSLTLTGVTGTAQDTGVAVYAGTITGGASNAFKGKTFQVTGFLVNPSNNGYFVCTASTNSTLTLANGLAVTESQASIAQIPTTAMTWANDPGASGDGNAVANSMEDICLVNNCYATSPLSGHPLNNGGNGYCTIGLDYSGAGRLQTKNLRIGGFGVGRQYISGVGWGAKDFNMSLSWNNVGSIFHDGYEGYSWFGGAASVNGIHVQLSGTNIVGADINFHGVSIDSATLYGVLAFSGLGSQITFNACHFENLAGSVIAPHYVLVQPFGSVAEFGTNVSLFGCQIVDDFTSGTFDYMFSIGVGSSQQASISCFGCEFACPSGRAGTVFLLGSASTGFFQGVNYTPARLTMFSGGIVTSLMSPQNPFTFSSGLSTTGLVATGQVTGSKLTTAGSAPTVAVSPTGLGTTGTATIFGGTDSNFIVQLNPGGSSIAASGSVTITFNSAFVDTTGTIVSAMAHNGTGTWNARATYTVTASGKTSITFTWDNNAVALTGGSIYFIDMHVIGF